jgi:hypothetical protein
MILLKKLKAQFQPSSASDVTAVVEAYRNTPVRVVETASVPRRPNLGSWTRRPLIRAPGIPRTAMIRELRYVI